MNHPLATIDLIAYRGASEPFPVQVRLFSPELTDPPSTYSCVVELHGLSSRARRIYGEGSFQALCLAAQHAIQSLATFAEQEGQLENTEGESFDPTVFGFRLLT
jgi:hypothetical protein